MGENKLIAMLGLNSADAAGFFAAYDKGLPFAKATAERAKLAAIKKGFIKTILGRRARFPFWESCDWGQAQRGGFMDEEVARGKYGSRVRRAKTHKALNAYTQGSGGDIIKKAMLDCWKQGGEVPLVTVHDENGYSIPLGEDGDKRKKHIIKLMENVVKLKVPLLVDADCGSNWGNVK